MKSKLLAFFVICLVPFVVLFVKINELSFHNGANIKVSTKDLQLFWLRKIANETEDLSEVWLFFTTLNEIKKRAQAYIAANTQTQAKSFSSFLASPNSKADGIDTKLLDPELIKKILNRRKKIENRIPTGFPSDLSKFARKGSQIGGSIGHNPHDILIVVKCKLITLLINSEDSRFLKEVREEFYYIQKNEGFCQWSYCGKMQPFIYYENLFCPFCLSRTILPPFEKVVFVFPEDTKPICPKCNKALELTLRNEPTHIFFKDRK